MAEPRDSWWVDLLLVGLAATVPVALVVYGVEWTALRLAAGLPLALFLPGYALVSAMFPEPREDCDPPLTRETGEGIDRTMRTRVRGLTGIDRLGLAVALSAALTPGVALFHYVVGGSFAPLEITVGLGVLTWAFAFVGLARRLRLPASHRFTVSMGWPAVLFDRYFVPGSPHVRPSKPHEASNATDVALNVLLVCTLLVALTSATYAFVQPPTSQEYDELAVLTQDDDGEYVAGNYPDDLSNADTLHASITNERDRSREYVLQAILEVVDEDGAVVERDDQARHVVELEAGERTYVEHDPEPTLDGERLRLRYTLDFADETDRDDSDDPYRSVHVWIRGAPDGTSDGGGQAPTTTPGDPGTPTPDDSTTPTPGSSGTPTPEGSGTQTPTATPTQTDDGIGLGL